MMGLSLFAVWLLLVDGVPCPTASPFDTEYDDAALQACLDRGGLVELQPGSPGYLLRWGLNITRAGTSIDSTAPPQKATLLADVDFTGTLLHADGRQSNYSVANLVFDGRRDQRSVLNLCGTPKSPSLGPNLQFEGQNWVVHHVESWRAVCGSAMVVLASVFEIHDCIIQDNGRGVNEGAPPGVLPWADGMTVLLCDRGFIHNNELTDNTDIQLVSGGGACRVQNNTISSVNRHAFAGLNLGNFNGNGNHAGSVFSGNVITSELNKLTWGLMIGSHPWDSNVNVSDIGLVADNEVSGAWVNVAVDGIASGTLRNTAHKNPQGWFPYGYSNCNISMDFTAGDFGSASIEDGWTARLYHQGQCLPQ